MVKPLRLLPLSLKVNLTVKYMRCPFARSNCQNILPKIQMEEMKRRDITFLLIGGCYSFFSQSKTTRSGGAWVGGIARRGEGGIHKLMVKNKGCGVASHVKFFN
ncbi:hypothetical protein HanXRQr2_Chr15g0683101 [Helianthus annuus]|uniref:Uncharacterized protein n=1 Tax=Helianthus annuus TaxID=4232 RepID=A0A9K3E0G8_HELAN|nr:hypothetical protein HanXRQr2_Chr15g0683101 [Helianthus annuus]KAJ0472299.1 hypothetical protein HanHA89_Chr15g0605481 [Helianthus annuus]KAJ0647897.1 hypothetical protein HanLR1_Chr15g0566811 [Helianthus annuus]